MDWTHQELIVEAARPVELELKSSLFKLELDLWFLDSR